MSVHASHKEIPNKATYLGRLSKATWQARKCLNIALPFEGITSLPPNALFEMGEPGHGRGNMLLWATGRVSVEASDWRGVAKTLKRLQMAPFIRLLCVA